MVKVGLGWGYRGVMHTHRQWSTGGSMKSVEISQWVECRRELCRQEVILGRPLKLNHVEPVLPFEGLLGETHRRNAPDANVV